MKTETEIILPDDPRAARYVTDVKGWVSRDGCFYGNDERLARWAGSTHNVCEACEVVTVRPHTKCPACRAKAGAERHAKRDTRPYNGEPIYSEAIEEFFFDDGDLADYLEGDDALPLEDLRLVFCYPQFVDCIDAEDQWNDVIPEDGEAPDWLREAVETLNDTIREHRDHPISWLGGNVAVDVATIHVDRGVGCP